MLLDRYNQTITSYVSIASLIHKIAVGHPNKVAIKHGDKKMSFAELEADSNKIGNYLIKNNIQKGDVIAVAMNRSIELVSCLLGIIKSGATYLPIDPGLPFDRITYYLKDSSCKTLITEQGFTSKFSTIKEKILFDEMWSAIDSNPIIKRIQQPEDIIYILYTSGTSGMPKGVIVTHENFSNFLLSIQKLPGISEADNILSITTISFDISGLEIFIPLISGAQLTIVDADVSKDGRLLLNKIIEENITIVQATPFTWQMMLENGWTSPLPIKAFCGGESLPKELAMQLCDRCHELWNMYGPTETTVYSIIKKISREDKIIAIGNPIDNTHIYLLDQDLRKIEQGQEGEIVIGGSGVSKGYLNRPELTTEKFLEDPYAGKPGQKMYRTGDRGKMLQNGDLQYLGRIDDQIKIRGYRIEPTEIEHQLKKLKHIKKALIQLYIDPNKNAQLVAYVVPDQTLSLEDFSTQIDAWMAQLKTILPSYMLPNKFLGIPEIPLKLNGKIDKKSLPDPDQYCSHNEFISPHTELEKKLCLIWAGHFKKDIGINDNFFELGGNSLIATKIMVQIDNLTKKRIPISNLFKYPTIRLISSFISGSFDQEFKSLIPIKPNGTKFPLYIVHGIGLNLLHLGTMVRLLGAEQPVYGLQPPGMDGNRSTLQTIEEIASFYNSEIKRHNPTGPYLLAGFSFGGYLAYEMAKQFIAEGKEVRRLIMFDTVLQYPTHQYPLFKKIYIKTIRQFFKAQFRIPLFFTHPIQNLQYLSSFYSKRIKLLRGERGVLKQYLINSPDYILDIALTLEKAFEKYKIEPIHIEIDLFKARTRFYFVDDPLYYGWKAYALKGVQVYTIPGDHNDIFNAPNVAILASVLQKRLDQANLF
ncbi:MAG: amino acid adenylation domain-containing protein [Flavisolibacter sp.]